MSATTLSLWYYPPKKVTRPLNRGEYMAADALGRLIRKGDVCGFASRRGAQVSLQFVVVREIGSEGVKGDKLTAVKTEKGWSVKRKVTRLIQPGHLVILDLDEKQASELIRLHGGENE